MENNMSFLKHLNATELRETIDYSKGLIADAEQDIGNMENNILQNQQGIKSAQSRISGQRERINWAKKYLKEKSEIPLSDYVVGNYYEEIGVPPGYHNLVCSLERSGGKQMIRLCNNAPSLIKAPYICTYRSTDLFRLVDKPTIEIMNHEE